MLEKAVDQLVSVHLIETDLHEVLWRFSFPKIDDSQRLFVERHLKSDGEVSEGNSHLTKFRYFHYQCWIYQHLSDHKNGKQMSILVFATDFNPEKYEAFTKIMLQSYRKNGQIDKLFDLYLSVIIEGSCKSDENGSLAFKEFDQLKVMSEKSSIKSIIKMFGLDVILIYTALILKKRIAVYHHNLDTLLQFVRSLPAFVWHRQNWSQILFPTIDLSSREEIEQLESHSHYVAGFLDGDIEAKPELYDVFVNLAAVEITISHTSRDFFSMTKTHKDIAVFMSRQAESSSSDFMVIKEINSKTMELIQTLKSMGASDETEDSSSNSRVTVEAIKAKNLSSSLESFLLNLAVAENLM